MPCCSAVNCSNNTAKGFKLYRFPRDKTRRREWAVKVKRLNWESKDTSYLCEVSAVCLSDNTDLLQLLTLKNCYKLINSYLS